ncbi:MAG: type II secretion system protein GspN [Deltaproteobacteria bacterium]|nr:type II secretion system protein GspN [Deltaproteobacteria bacterium]
MQSTLVKALVYPLFFLLATVFFLIQGFPIEMIGERIKQQAETRMGMKLSYATLETSFPNGIKASSVRLMKPSEEEGDPGFSLLLDRAEASISLLGLLFGDRDLSIDLELLSGRITGDISLDEEQPSINLKLTALDLGKLPIWQDLLGLPLAGKLGGVIDLALNKDVKKTQGKIQLNLEQASLGEGKIKGFNSPSIALGKPQLELLLDKGKAEIKTFKISSDDAEADMEGYFLLQKQLSKMTAKTKVHFKLSDAKFQEFLSKIPPELQSMATTQVNRAKGKDGSFHYSLIGRLDHPQFRSIKQ